MMKSPIAIAALIVSVAIVISVIIVMWPIYACMHNDNVRVFVCLHGPMR